MKRSSPAARLRTPRPQRICLVYDCLYPWTVGGAERWYRALAERLAADGADVTYLTLRQWERDAPAAIPGVHIVAAGPRTALYARQRRRIAPPLLFGLGVLRHLLLHGRRYDLVHAAAFPFFPALAAALLRPLWRYGLVVDWWEVWSRRYWAGYLGPVGGRVGWLVQRRLARVPQRAICYSRLHAGRLRSLGGSEPTILRNVLPEPLVGHEPEPAAPLVLFAGRLIPEKRAAAIVPAVAAARRALPELCASIVGDGPERAAIGRLIAAFGLRDAIAVPGFVSQDELAAAMRRALCLVLPSSREGYGLIVLEAAAAGVPSIVVRGADNAAAEWIEEGVNGFVVGSPSESDLASAILRAHAMGPALRRSTADWFARQATSTAGDAALRDIRAVYAAAQSSAAGPPTQSTA